jgi:hypothetical protein
MMKLSLDWSSYKDSGMGDAYADIPKQGGDFAKAIAVCISSGQCETDNKLLMCPSFKVSGAPELSTGGKVHSGILDWRKPWTYVFPVKAASVSVTTTSIWR